MSHEDLNSEDRKCLHPPRNIWQDKSRAATVSGLKESQSTCGASVQTASGSHKLKRKDKHQRCTELTVRQTAQYLFCSSDEGTKMHLFTSDEEHLIVPLLYCTSWKSQIHSFKGRFKNIFPLWENRWKFYQKRVHTCFKRSTGSVSLHSSWHSCSMFHSRHSFEGFTALMCCASLTTTASSHLQPSSPKFTEYVSSVAPSQASMVLWRCSTTITAVDL